MAPESQRPRCFAITGPTASGKTDLALALVREFPFEIVSMDSALVYRGMDIGTAKPDPGIRASVPHHLIDILDPEQSYSAGRFAADATRLIRDIHARGRLALVVGGTMLYLKALREGIAPLPERDLEIRAAIDAEAAERGWAAMHAELAAIDAEAARRIEPGDRQRIQRALEVHALTGRSLSELQRATAVTGVSVESIALIPGDRARLGRTIERRFAAMVEAGLIEEVRRLRERPDLSARSASMRAVGYRQIWAHLDGRLSWPEARDRAVAATRQLAKRQLTWLRGDVGSRRLAVEEAGLADRLRRCVNDWVNDA
jgi:tRNA dimethylallyltransferase